MLIREKYLKKLVLKLCVMMLCAVVITALPLSASADTETAYKLSYILDAETFGGEAYYDMNNTATGSIYTVAGSSSDAIEDLTYEVGFKIKLSNPAAASTLQIQLMGSTTSANILNNVKFVSYDSHDYAYRLLRSNALIADRDDGLVTDGETWNDIRFVIRETASDGDTTTTTDDTVTYDVYINGTLVSTQTEIAVSGLNGEQAAKRNPYQLRFKHDTNAGNSILIDDVWIAKYVPYEPIYTEKLVCTMDNQTFGGEDTYDMNNTATGSVYEIACSSADAIEDLTYEAGFKIKLSNPAAASTLQIQLMGSASANILNNVKFVSYDSHDYAYRLLRSSTLIADRDDGLVTDGETWNDIRFVIRETASDGDTTTTTDDTVTYDVYINGTLVSTQTEIAVSGLNGEDASKRNPYKWRFKHDNNAGNSILIDDVWIAKYVPSGIGWEFDDAVELNNYWKSSSTNYSVEDGVLSYSAPAEYEEASLIYTPEEAIDNTVYAGLKVKMKAASSGNMKLYISGTAADGTAFDYTTGAISLAVEESDSEFIEYSLPLNETLGETDISTAAITSLKLVPTDTLSDYEIESIWIVDDLSVPLDESKISLSYEFSDDTVGTAMGTIKLDFGGQKSYNAKEAVLYWATGNEEDGYTPLADYVRIVKLTGEDLENGYTITKNMIIPESARVLIARITDIEKTFDTAYTIPAEKLIEEKEPGMVIALTSDFHFGDPTYMTHEPSEKILKAREILDEQADVILVGGDTVDTFGGRSWYTVRGMNGLASYGYRMDPAEEESDEVTITYYKTEEITDEDGNTTKVLTDEPTGKVETVKNTDVYEMAYNYFIGFDKPVYLAEGNHESPEAAYLDYIGVSPQRTKNLITKFIDWSVANGKYSGPIERTVSVYENQYEDSISYDDYITDEQGNEYHCIFLRNFGSDRPVKLLTEQELDWLDQKLYENESTGKPIFVLSHIMPVRNKVGKMQSYGYYGLDFPEFEEIINKHPSAVIVSGHTHQSQDQDNQSYYDGKEEEPSYINVPAMKHSWINDSELDGAYAMLVYAEMYDDRIITRAFETATEKIPPRGVGQITRKPIPAQLGEISVERIENSDGTITLTAGCGDTSVTYEWILKGEAQAGKSVTLAPDYEGYIAVRATDADGNYISDSFDGLYDEELMGAPEKTYFAVAGQKNGLNPLVNASGEDAVWENGVGGKNTADESALIAGGSYQLENAWTKQNESSRYLVISFDVMPKNETVKDFYVSADDTVISAASGEALEVNKWNNIKIVCDIAGAETETLVNGNSAGTVALTPSEGCYIRFGFDGNADGYIDNLVVYETSHTPVLPECIEKVFDEISGDTLYSAEKKTLYLPEGVLCSQTDYAVVSSDGSTKSADSAVTDGDFALYHDPNSRSFVYYNIVTYSDYDRLHISGNVEDEDVIIYVNAKTADDTFVVAYYDSNERFVGCEFPSEIVAGLNKLSLNECDGAHSAKIMVWQSMNGLVPLASAINIE